MKNSETSIAKSETLREEVLEAFIAQGTTPSNLKSIIGRDVQPLDLASACDHALAQLRAIGDIDLLVERGRMIFRLHRLYKDANDAGEFSPALQALKELNKLLRLNEYGFSQAQGEDDEMVEMVSLDSVRGNWEVFVGMLRESLEAIPDRVSVAVCKMKTASSVARRLKKELQKALDDALGVGKGL